MHESAEKPMIPPKQIKIKLNGKKLKIIPKKSNNNNKTRTLIKRSSPNVIVKDEPLVKSTSLKMPSPKFSLGKDGSMILSHCELINSVTTVNTNDDKNGFNIIGFPVNAGLKATFPFLSSLAQNYKSYEFEQLSFTFIARGNYTRDGAIMFYAEYDPDTQPPENRIEFLNRSNAVEAQVFKNTTYSLKKKDMSKEKSHYVRLGKIDEKSDLKLYDCANLFFAYEGTPKNTLIGDIFVNYTVRLVTPTLRLAEKQVKNIESTKGTGFSSGQTMTNPFGGTAGLTAGNFVGDFLSGLLSAATGGLAGQFFSTAKSVCKFIQFLLPQQGGAYTPNDIDLQLSVPKSSYEYNKTLKEGFVMFINEDDEDLLYTAANCSSETDYTNKFLDITSTNVKAISNGVNGVTTDKIQTFAVVWPPNAILRCKMVSGGGNIPPGPYPTITITDYDGRKSGEIDPSLVQFFSD